MTAGLAERATVAGYLACWRAVRWLPEASARSAFLALADQAWRRRGAGTIRLETNLARVLATTPDDPAVRAVSREGLRSYARYWLEAFLLSDWGPERIRTRMTVANWNLVTAAVRERGAVVALPHMGNWDLAGAWAATNGVPVTAVAERLRPAALYRRFVEFRERLGIEVVGLGDTDATTTLVRRAGEHRLICLLADRVFGSTGVDVDFFGAPARMPAGPAVVALRAGVPLLPVTLWYDDLARVRVHPAVAVPADGDERAKAEAMTRQVAAVFERAIRTHPADWHMLQRVWTGERDSGDVSGTVES